MGAGAVIIIISGMIFGTGLITILLDYWQKGRKKTAAGDQQRIDTLEKKLELQEGQISELIENQRFMQNLIEDKHED